METDFVNGSRYLIDSVCVHMSKVFIILDFVRTLKHMLSISGKLNGFNGLKHLGYDNMIIN